MKIANFKHTTTVTVTMTVHERKWLIFALTYLAGDGTKDERNRCKRYIAQLERAGKES